MMTATLPARILIVDDDGGDVPLIAGSWRRQAASCTSANRSEGDRARVRRHRSISSSRTSTAMARIGPRRAQSLQQRIRWRGGAYQRFGSSYGGAGRARGRLRLTSGTAVTSREVVPTVFRALSARQQGWHKRRTGQWSAPEGIIGRTLHLAVLHQIAYAVDRWRRY